jgi:hypothetical protein
MLGREGMRDWYWIWDFNHAVDHNETLRGEGFKVVCGGRHADTMEHDRASCINFAATYGIERTRLASFLERRRRSAPWTWASSSAARSSARR